MQNTGVATHVGCTCREMDMESTRYEVLPGVVGWVIRRNTHDRAYCGDRESALHLALALAQGERYQAADDADCSVWIREQDGTWSEAAAVN